MNASSGRRSIAALLLAGSLSGCLFAGPRGGASAPLVSITFINREPPPERVEVISTRPYAEAVWIGGRWTARGDNYAWTPGHWARPEAGKSEWEKGKWEHGDRGWYYTEGHWR